MATVRSVRSSSVVHTHAGTHTQRETVEISNFKFALVSRHKSGICGLFRARGLMADVQQSERVWCALVSAGAHLRL